MNPFNEENRLMFNQDLVNKTTRYENPNKKKQSLILKGDGTSSTNFRLPLHEPLRVDSITDIYLDSFMTNDGFVNNTDDNQYFIINIDEFELKTISNNPSVNGGIIIPNDNTSVGGPQVHKGKKLNYISTIFPKTITEINGSIKGIHEDRMINDNAITFTNKISNGEEIIITDENGQVITITTTSAVSGGEHRLKSDAGGTENDNFVITSITTGTIITTANAADNAQAFINLIIALNDFNKVDTETAGAIALPTGITVDSAVSIIGATTTAEASTVVNITNTGGRAFGGVHTTLISDKKQGHFIMELLFIERD